MCMGVCVCGREQSVVGMGCGCIWAVVMRKAGGREGGREGVCVCYVVRYQRWQSAARQCGRGQG